MARDDIAKVRGLAGELGYRLEPLPIRGCWQIVNESMGEIAKRPDGATAFNVDSGAIFLPVVATIGRHPCGRSLEDEKHLVLSPDAYRDLGRLRTDAGNLELGMLAFLIAQAQDEAQGQLEKLESEVWPEDE